MFALGMIYWMFEQSVEHTEAFFDIKFGKKPAIASANKMVLRAGYNYAANVHALATHFKVAPATIEKGKYRTAWGYQGGLEFYPMADDNLHIFLTAIGKKYNLSERAKALDASLDDTARLSIGFIYRLPLY